MNPRRKTSTYLFLTCDSELDRDKGLDGLDASLDEPSPDGLDERWMAPDGGMVVIAGVGGAEVAAAGVRPRASAPSLPPAPARLSLRSTHDLSFSS